eukprot:CAMPEP_0116899062 /NCGR_PEP_ID=MMETSP0467-20121206/7700_1 /TAXON_ID=283647 /ORGANISM="Mesodinium pulex, Strain SPMC105" /LENGTH=72 /DNA_ID=CAMNT_0004571645 /DNA_START=1006 /DNA_END=1224 /DNA_ORIENTATION=-
MPEDIHRHEHKVNMLRYARGIAYASLKDVENARKAQKIFLEGNILGTKRSQFFIPHTLTNAIAVEMLEGEIL